MKATNTERQETRILEYLAIHAREKDLKAPLRPLGEFLLNDFGLPQSAGREVARGILRKLEEAGKLCCTYDKRQVLYAVRLATEKMPVAAPAVVAKISLPMPYVRPKVDHKQLTREKRADRKAKAMRERGDRNEGRCFQICYRIVKLLLNVFPEKIVRADCKRSGRHNPAEGKIDHADRRGEDVGIRLTARLESDSMIDGRIILDAKSSGKDAKKFNEDIRFGRYERETHVLLKRAITVNDSRHDAAIAGEILANLVAAGFDFIAIEKETILQTFQSY